MKKFLYKLFFLVVVASVFPACTDNFAELNTNPNAPTDVPSTNILVSAITNSVSRIHGADMNMTYGGLWAQHYAKIQYIDEDYYSYRTANMDAHWTGLYVGPLLDLQTIIEKEGVGVNMKAASMTMKAHIFSVITDMWGDIPYFSALKGGEAIQPVYDSQQDIYNDLVAQLEQAAAMFDDNGDDLGAGDVLFGGDISSWRKLANSLRMRLLNRMAGVNPSAKATLESMLNAGVPVISSNDENASLVYIGDVSYSNPLYANKYLSGRNDHAISKTMVDLLSSLNDPRLAVYAKPTANDPTAYVGQPNGSVQPGDFGTISLIGPTFRDDPKGPSHIMTYAEVLFIKAEVQNDKQAYLDGIAAAMDMYGLAPDTDYITAAEAAFDANAVEAIANQRWIALFGNGCEAFSEYRRTGYPSTIQEVPGSVYPGKGVPLRFAYATTEFTTNGTNLASAISKQGVDDSGLFGAKMWWAK
ncbi:MAG: SusD/RagB family nutrient-binding outer membrane lipoprotein [Bacteroidia bacterium]